MASNNGASASAPTSGSSTPNPRFVSQNTVAKDLLKSQTVGLVHLDDFRKRRAEAIDLELGTPGSGAATRDVVFKKKKRKTVKKGGLSFGDDEDSQGESAVTTSTYSRSGTPDNNRNPTPASEADDTKDTKDTVPVKKRLAANSNVGFHAKSMTKAALLRDAHTKDQLRKDFLAMQDSVKATDFLMPFVFYVGKDIPGGVCRMKKGDLVWLFLDRARKAGVEVSSSDRSRREWARVSVDDLMLVRGDLIIPHHYDFYYFMLNKTVGYDGPLFAYSAEPTSASPLDDETLSTSAGLAVPDAPSKTSVKPQSQHSLVPDTDLEGFANAPSLTKVVDRRWYEKNKHIYPASTWEDFDPTRNYSAGVRKDTEGNAFFFSR